MVTLCGFAPTAAQEGYVARMYLNSDSNAVVPMTKKAPVSSAHVDNGIARWAAGAPGCDEFISHGRHVESITANGITVQVSVFQAVDGSMGAERGGVKSIGRG